MKRELARLLTTALTQFIDKNSGDSEMCLSSAECEGMEKAFEANNMVYIEGIVKRKLYIKKDLPPFKRALAKLIQKALISLECTGEIDGLAEEYAMSDEADELKHIAYLEQTDGLTWMRTAEWEAEKERCRLIGKQQARIELVESGQGLCISHDIGYDAGVAETMKRMPKWRKWHNGACGNSDGVPIAIVKRGIKYELVSCLGIEGEEYIMLSELDKLPKIDDND